MPVAPSGTTIDIHTHWYPREWLDPPREIVERLQREIVYAAKLPEVRDRLVEQGYDVEPTSPERLAESIREGRARMQRIVREAGIKPD